MRYPRSVAALTLLVSTAAGATVRPLLSHAASATDGATVVEVTLLNDGGAPETFHAPTTLGATLRGPAGERAVTLTRATGQAAGVNVPPGGFARLRYTFRAPADATGSVVLTVPEWAREGLAFEMAGDTRLARATPPASRPRTGVDSGETYVARYRSADGDRGNAFLPNLTAYEPVYAVYGPGTDSDARLQISFKYQLLGDARDAERRWIDGFHFAFTQRLYWNLGRESSPFRNVDYLPELFYLVPPRPVSSAVTLGGQAGFRHESNGRGGLDSRSYNTIYVQPYASTALGDYKLTVAPRLWLYAGSLDDNPDIRRYRGNAGLLVEIGRDDGWRLTTQGRLNPGSGKGALDALLSYPLDVAVARDLKLYAFGQGFVGYGENLLDYRRHQTRLRIGIGLVR